MGLLKRIRSFQISELLVVLAIASWFSLYQIDSWSFGVGDLDQVIHAKVTQEMVHEGKYMAPTLDGRTYSNKPPFKMWLSAATVLLLGESTFSYRIIDGITATLFLLGFFCYCRARLPCRFGAWFALIALLACRNLFEAHGIRDSAQDLMLNFLMFAVLVAIDYGIQMIKEARIRWGWSLFIISGVLFGCAVLTKSAGAFIVIPVIGSAILLSGQAVKLIKAAWQQILCSIFIGLCIPALYWSLRLARSEPGTLRNIWYSEVVQRVVEGAQNKERSFFYFRLLFEDASAVPPLVFVISLVISLYYLLYKRDPRAALPLSWAVVPILLYSFAQTRQPWYIHFAYPGIAMLVGFSLSPALGNLSWRRDGQTHQQTGRYPRLFGSLAMISIFAWQLFPGIERNTRKIARPREKIEIEQLVVTLQKNLSFEAGKGRAFHMIPKKMSLREERFYLEMLGIKRIRRKELPRAIVRSDLRLLVADLKQFRVLARLRRPLGISFVSPRFKRTAWLAILYYNSADINAVPRKNVLFSDLSLDLSGELPAGFKGLSERVAYAGGEGRMISDSEFSHPIPSRGGTGVTLGYRVSLIDPSRPVLVEAFAGADSIGSALVDAPAITSISFSIPADRVTRDSKNLRLVVASPGCATNKVRGCLVLHGIESSVKF